MRDGIVPVMEVNGNNGGNGMFGNNGDWAWIIILFLIFGWGGRGFGNGFGGNGGSGAYDNYVLASDFSQLSRQISDGFSGVERRTDSIINGLCDGFYTQAQLINGVNANISNLGYNLQNCCCDIKSQLADCCCTTQRAIDGVNYNLATNTCAITNNATQNTRDIIEAVNSNYRALHDELVSNKLEAKNDRIAELNSEVNALRLKASQEAQNNFLISKLGDKCPEPAYVVQPPQQVTFPTNCCNQFSGYNNGCGCGNY